MRCEITHNGSVMNAQMLPLDGRRAGVGGGVGGDPQLTSSLFHVVVVVTVVALGQDCMSSGGCTNH